MGYVIVDTKTRCSVRHPRTRRETYSTEAAARAVRAAMTRMGAEGHEVMDTASYAAQVPMIVVTNLMSQEKVMIRADTPWSCRVDSESYWSS